MARLKGRLNLRRRHGARERSLNRLPLVDGDFPGPEMSRLAERRGVVVREGGKYYLVRGGMLRGPREGTAGEVARRFGTRLKTPRTRYPDRQGPSDEGGGGLLGEATFNKNLEMVGAAMRSPVALVVCVKNASHIYVAESYETCPRDGEKLVRLERS